MDLDYDVIYCGGSICLNPLKQVKSFGPGGAGNVALTTQPGLNPLKQVKSFGQELKEQASGGMNEVLIP